MVHRINITLSDELHERLKPFKDTLNISAICQRAVDTVISFEEAKAKAMSKRAKTIVGLRQEAKNIHDEWFQQGKKDALSFGGDISYESFVEIEGFEGGEEEAIELANDSCDWMREWAEVDVPQKWQPKYFLGLIEGAKEFWLDIKDEVNDA